MRAVSIEDEQYGHNVLTTLSQQFELDYDHKRYDEVMEVVEQLTEGISAQSQPWHVHVFKHDEFRNAAATRGNHIFIWTAMIDATKSRGELSAILSHEIAHVLAGHTDPDPQEEINKMLIGIGALAAGIAVSAVTPDPTLASNLGQLTSSVTEELGNGLITNPYSRRLELEADQVGLMIMAKSKFDPNEALAFWKRASQDPSFSNHAEFFSTHPIAKQRLEKLQELLPKAMEVYRNPSSLAVGVAQPQQPATLPTVSQSPASTRTALPDKNEQWRTVSNADVYDSPDAQSRKRGEIAAGTTIEVVGTMRGWVEVSSPVNGFIRGINAEPLP